MSRVYVLGAGASKGVNPDAPLMDELSSRVWNIVNQEKVFSRLNAFFKEFYPEPKSQKETLGLETILSQLDISILENRPLSPRYSVRCIRRLRNQLVHAICKAIQVSLVRNDEYQQMCDLVDHFLGSLSDDDCIISLNYDLIVDNRLHVLHQGAVNYGISVRRYVDSSNAANDSSIDLAPYPQYTRSIKLYKLHGSLNWLYNPLLRTIDISGSQKGTLRYIFEPRYPSLARCPISQVPYEPVIVTPSFLKEYDNRYIQEIWEGAESSLREADEVVFIGYSLPKADMILRCMFKRALFGNRNLRKITVVDFNKECRNEVRTRYEQLFGEIKYFKHGFGRYIEKLRTHT